MGINKTGLAETAVVIVAMLVRIPAICREVLSVPQSRLQAAVIVPPRKNQRRRHEHV